MAINQCYVGNKGQELVLETNGRVYIKVHDKKYELNFRNQTSGTPTPIEGGIVDIKVDGTSVKVENNVAFIELAKAINSALDSKTYDKATIDQKIKAALDKINLSDYVKKSDLEDTNFVKSHIKLKQINGTEIYGEGNIIITSESGLASETIRETAITYNTVKSIVSASVADDDDSWDTL